MATAQAKVDASQPFARLPRTLGPSDLPSQIRELLEEAIVSGVLEPGQRVQTELLASHYGVSRIPVREALRSLEAAGWVQIRPRYGVYVAERSESELLDLFDVRAVLEGHVARRAAERRTADDLAELSRIVEASRAAASAGDDEALSTLSSEFYAAVRRAARNAVLEATLASMEKRARFYFSTVVHQMGRNWVQTHRQLLAAIKKRDADTAARIADEHVAETGRAVHRLLSA